MTEGRPNSVEASWDRVYADDSAPWDLGRPQQVWVDLADAREISSPLLDSGCGTGEHTLLFASRGMAVVGVDISTTAIERARWKAAERDMEATFLVGDVLALDQMNQRFATIIDSGVFHIFDDGDRSRYVESLASTVEQGGVLHLLCFSEHTPGENGPRRVTQRELHESFADGWEIERIDPALLEVRPEWAPEPARGWLARIIRTA